MAGGVNPPLGHRVRQHRLEFGAGAAAEIEDVQIVDIEDARRLADLA
jgi:hypothetical protein